MMPDKSLQHAASTVNQAIAATLVECGYWFYTDARQSVGSKDEADFLRFWRLRFTFDKDGQKLTIPILLFLGQSSVIRFWSILNSREKLEDSERAKIYQAIRDGQQGTRASFSSDGASPKQILVEVDQYIDSASSITRGLIENAVGNVYKAAVKLVVDFDCMPAEVSY